MARVNLDGTPQKEINWGDFWGNFGSGALEYASDLAAKNAETRAKAQEDFNKTHQLNGDYLKTRAEKNLGTGQPAENVRSEADILQTYDGIDTSKISYDNSPEYDPAFPSYVLPQPKAENEDKGNGGGGNNASYAPPQQETQEPEETPSGTDIANEATAQATLNAKQQDYVNKQQNFINQLQAKQGLLGQLAPQRAMPRYDGSFGNIYNKTDMSSDQFYAQQYNDLRNMGFSDRRARREAARRAGDYRLQRIFNINDAFNTFGLDENGVVNPLGTQLISAMGQEDTTRANTMHSLYPGLLDAYKYNQALNKLNAQAQNAMNKARYAEDRKDAREAYRHSNKLNEIDYKAARGIGTGKSSNAADKTPAEVKSAFEYIKWYENRHKDDLDTDWKNDARYQQQLGIYQDYMDSNYNKHEEAKPKLQFDFSDYNGTVSNLQALLESGRYSPKELATWLSSVTDDNDMLANYMAFLQKAADNGY